MVFSHNEKVLIDSNQILQYSSIHVKERTIVHHGACCFESSQYTLERRNFCRGNGTID